MIGSGDGKLTEETKEKHSESVHEKPTEYNALNL